jgi:hypothetical protein
VRLRRRLCENAVLPLLSAIIVLAATDVVTALECHPYAARWFFSAANTGSSSAGSGLRV